MVRLTAALISALNDGADCATIQSLSIPNRDFDQVVELDVCENLTRLDISGNRLPSLQVRISFLHFLTF
jgi:Leucine-rich repeat (LRR) protein